MTTCEWLPAATPVGKLIRLSRGEEIVDFAGKRALAGVGGLTLPLGSDDDGSAGGQRGRDSHEGEAVLATLFGFTEVDDSHGILPVVDAGREFGAQGDQLHGIQVADEHTILHRPAKTFHDLVNLAKAFTVSYIIR